MYYALQGGERARNTSSLGVLYPLAVTSPLNPQPAADEAIGFRVRGLGLGRPA